MCRYDRACRGHVRLCSPGTTQTAAQELLKSHLEDRLAPLVRMSTELLSYLAAEAPIRPGTANPPTVDMAPSQVLLGIWYDLSLAVSRRQVSFWPKEALIQKCPAMEVIFNEGINWTVWRRAAEARGALVRTAQSRSG